MRLRPGPPADEIEGVEGAIDAAEEETYRIKTLMEYRLDLLKKGGYEITTDGTEDYADQMLDQIIKMWNNK
jgi:hypothetical protein